MHGETLWTSQSNNNKARYLSNNRSRSFRMRKDVGGETRCYYKRLMHECLTSPWDKSLLLFLSTPSHLFRSPSSNFTLEELAPGFIGIMPNELNPRVQA